MILEVFGHTPNISPDAFLADNVTVAGDVTIAAGASLWFGTVVRTELAPIVIGEDSNLQDLTVVHADEDTPTFLGKRVTVGHRAILHGCVIGDDALIGMGAVLLNGSRIGAGAVVGAGAVITEGMEVPAGTLALGVPAKVFERPVPPVPRVNVANYLRFASEYRNARVVDSIDG
ncbi:MAG: gamma carbonic anhydrase family protein [Nitriliruptoraceae bacterium]